MEVFNKKALLNKKILITGASSGIGEGCAKQFSKCGAKLILLGRDENKLNNIRLELDNTQDHSILKADLSEEDEAFKVICNLKELVLPLDGIFHSAGKELIKPINLVKSADFNSVFFPSVKAAISISRALSRKNIMANNASVIFMSSVAAISGTPGLSAYSASKSAFIGLTKSLALEFAHRNIRFNSLLAGAVKTPMHERLLKNLSSKSKDEYEAKHPLGFGKTTDISNIATFLMSDASQWITGSSICVDGGYTAR